jgi:hypothetical protein
METLIKAQRKYNPHSKIRNFELGILTGAGQRFLDRTEYI